MKRKAVSSVFIAIFLIILAYGALLSIILLMAQPNAVPAPPKPRLLITYNLNTQYLNITNLGASAVEIYGLAFFSGGSGYVVPYSAVLNPGQSTFIYLYDALKANEAVVILTNEGAVEVRTPSA